ncbi:MAG: translation initiation factor IF-3 [Simkania negevensis]|nr:translation initiation factor IF-3 [Simkania negevensis]
MRINREIRAPKVRLIGKEGNQLGVVALSEALVLAERQGLDLVEISPNSAPPVCKIVDYGKFRYQQTKKEKESKKGRLQAKLKEIKLKLNIDEHDLQVKIRQAKEFVQKGNKVRVTCMFRGREMSRPELAERLVERLIQEVGDSAQVESPPSMMGKNLILVLGPSGKKKKKAIHTIGDELAKVEDEKSDQKSL